MKKMICTFLVMGLVACGAGIENASANLLSNGSLDTASVAAPSLPASWTVDQYKTASGPSSDLVSLEGFPVIGIDTNPGDVAGFLKAFQGTIANGANVDLYQGVAGTPGQQYRLSGYFGAGINYSGLIAATTTQTQLAIEFDGDNDRSNGFISSAILDVQAAGLVSGPFPGFGNKLFSISGTAPAGTAFVRARASMLNGYNPNAGADPSAFIDDFSLTAVPEPATLSMLGLAAVGLIGFRRRSK